MILIARTITGTVIGNQSHRPWYTSTWPGYYTNITVLRTIIRAVRSPHAHNYGLLVRGCTMGCQSHPLHGLSSCKLYGYCCMSVSIKTIPSSSISQYCILLWHINLNQTYSHNFQEHLRDSVRELAEHLAVAPLGRGVFARLPASLHVRDRRAGVALGHLRVVRTGLRSLGDACGYEIRLRHERAPGAMAGRKGLYFSKFGLKKDCVQPRRRIIVTHSDECETTHPSEDLRRTVVRPCRGRECCTTIVDEKDPFPNYPTRSRRRF